ncbi:hypothetical protein Scep_025836 [Stephania cephalantha]|uniref:Uncharacterized protein n=1 Tax=Stephania cephalantha TaxID=152367 RepID=A0AAP0EP81_9MAGN
MAGNCGVVCGGSWWEKMLERCLQRYVREHGTHHKAYPRATEVRRELTGIRRLVGDINSMHHKARSRAIVLRKEACTEKSAVDVADNYGVDTWRCWSEKMLEQDVRRYGREHRTHYEAHPRASEARRERIRIR